MKDWRNPLGNSGRGIRVQIEIKDIKAKRPSTYKLTLKNSTEQHTLVAISTGGGMMEIVEIDGIEVSLAGDYYETLIYIVSNGSEIVKYLQENTHADKILLLSGTDTQMIEVKAQNFLEDGIISALHAQYDVKYLKTILPVLPVMSSQNTRIPFITCDEMLKYNTDKNLALWELAVHYESARGNISHERLFRQMCEIVRLMQTTSIFAGIVRDKICRPHPRPSTRAIQNAHGKSAAARWRNVKSDDPVCDRHDGGEKLNGCDRRSAHSRACAGFPGACIGAATSLGLSIDEMTRAMLSAGMIGVFIAAHATFAAEVGGCQAECGSGSGMAAAALVTLANGTLKQSVDAASMALQNTVGMVCDPVANRVEVPCLGKNVLAASNALACANMALADYDAVIPLDEVIETLDRVGKSIPHELRCTALGGLSITKTSKEIEERLQDVRGVINAQSDE